MVLMVLDHVRDFVTGNAFDPLNLDHTTPAYYVTRWVTHLVAPGFIFLTGASAFLYGRRPGRTTKDVSMFLLTRGFWLIAVEMLIVNIGWMGKPAPQFQSLQVIWAIGWSMVALSALVWLPRLWIAITGGLIVAGHNAVVMLLERSSQFPPFAYAEQMTVGDYLRAWLFQPTLVVFAPTGTTPFDDPPIAGFVYPIAAWIGVIAIGYAVAPVFTWDHERRKRALTVAAGACFAGFLVLRMINLYGDSYQWEEQSRGSGWTVLSFLNVTKYPASLQFLLVTIAPTLFALPRLEQPSTWPHRFLQTLGQVPFFFYVAHLLLARAIGHTLGAMQGYSWSELTGVRFFAITIVDPSFGQPLWLSYIVTIAVVMVLLPACRWFGRIKRQHPDSKWLSYL